MNANMGKKGSYSEKEGVVSLDNTFCWHHYRIKSPKYKKSPAGTGLFKLTKW